MGDRSSISFKNQGHESVALFNHWGGIEFFEDAEDYILEVIRESEGKEASIGPMERIDPEWAIVDFIRWYHEQHPESRHGDRCCDSLYLGMDAGDGDNSDNGHRIIDIERLKQRFHGTKSK